MFLEKPLVWRAVACVLAYAFVVGGPTLAKPVWEDAVALFPTKQSAQIWIPVIANCLVQVGFLLAMLPLYAFGLCNQWRVEKDKPWPWQAAAAASERERFWRAARRSALLVPFNAVFLGQASLRYIVLPINPMIGALATDIASFPTPFTLFWQLAGCMVVEVRSQCPAARCCFRTCSVCSRAAAAHQLIRKNRLTAHVSPSYRISCFTGLTAPCTRLNICTGAFHISLSVFTLSPRANISLAKVCSAEMCIQLVSRLRRQQRAQVAPRVHDRCLFRLGACPPD